MTPPSLAWRKRTHIDAKNPAPQIEPIISSMTELEAMAHPLRPRDAEYLDGGNPNQGGGNLSVFFIFFCIILFGLFHFFSKGKKMKENGVRRGHINYAHSTV